MGALINLTGKRFGYWVVLERTGADRSGKPTWLCRCECGTERIVTGSNLRGGYSKSCGCVLVEQLTKHGKFNSPEYKIWSAMIQRCTNPNSQNYHRYGGRGVRVCERWLKFENFLADMGERPDGTTLDRVDNDGNYEVTNCRWATRETQYRNRSTNRNITYHGIEMCLTDWASILKVGVELLRRRISKLGEARAISSILDKGSDLELHCNQ